jgi:hypothetical protein
VKGSVIRTSLHGLRRLEELSRSLGGGIGNCDEPPPLFPLFEEAIKKFEASFGARRRPVKSREAEELWASRFLDGIPKAHLTSLDIDRLCDIPSISMSPAFIAHLQSRKMPLSRRATIAMVRSYHREWGELVNRFGVVEFLRGRFSEGEDEGSPRLRLWRGYLRFLVDPNDVDNLSLEAVNNRLSSAQLAVRFGIDDDSGFMSAVTSTAIRRICQRPRPSPDDLHYVVDGLLPYRWFRPRDLGRALSNLILMNSGRPPSVIHKAVQGIALAHPNLGPLPRNLVRWGETVDEEAIAAAQRWAWDEKV